MPHSPLLIVPGAGLARHDVQTMLRSIDPLVSCRIQEAPTELAESVNGMAAWLSESAEPSAILLHPVGGSVDYGRRLEDELAGRCSNLRRVFIAACRNERPEHAGEAWCNVEAAILAAALERGHGVHIAAEGKIRPIGELTDIVARPAPAPVLTETQIADPLGTVSAEGRYSDVRLKEDRHGRWRIGDVVYKGGIKAKATVDHSPAGLHFVESALRRPPQPLGRS